MASPTPARILGVEVRVGSLEVGKAADVLALDEQLRVQSVFLQGRRVR